MNVSVGSAMLIVFLGTAISMIRIHGTHLIPFRDSQSMFLYLFGIFTMAASAVSQAGRLTYQELAFASFRGVSPLDLLSFASVFSTTLILLMAIVAQAMPGEDNGCLVRISSSELCLLGRIY